MTETAGQETRAAETVPSQVSPPVSRNKERTREAILDAAARLFFEQGAGVSLATIAADAGVSKGALTHHFATRVTLERALIERSTAQFWRDVHAHLDPADTAEGRLLRAYIYALTSDETFRREHFSPTALLGVLGAVDAVADLMQADAERWRQAFVADGVDPLQSLMLRTAAEGAAMIIDTPYLNDDERTQLTAHLVSAAVAVV